MDFDTRRKQLTLAIEQCKAEIASAQERITNLTAQANMMAGQLVLIDELRKETAPAPTAAPALRAVGSESPPPDVTGVAA